MKFMLLLMEFFQTFPLAIKYLKLYESIIKSSKSDTSSKNNAILEQCSRVSNEPKAVFVLDLVCISITHSVFVSLTCRAFQCLRCYKVP